MPLNLIDDKSTLDQVMAWCRQATSHYLNQCWHRSMSPNGVTRPQWVNSQARLFVDDCLMYRPMFSYKRTSLPWRDGATHHGTWNLTRKNVKLWPSLEADSVSHTFIHFVGIILESVWEAMYLGIIVSDELSWSPVFNPGLPVAKPSKMSSSSQRDLIFDFNSFCYGICCPHMGSPFTKRYKFVGKCTTTSRLFYYCRGLSYHLKCYPYVTSPGTTWAKVPSQGTSSWHWCLKWFMGMLELMRPPLYKASHQRTSVLRCKLLFI